MIKNHNHTKYTHTDILRGGRVRWEGLLSLDRGTGSENLGLCLHGTVALLSPGNGLLLLGGVAERTLVQIRLGLGRG